MSGNLLYYYRNNLLRYSSPTICINASREPQIILGLVTLVLLAPNINTNITGGFLGQMARQSCPNLRRYNVYLLYKAAPPPINPFSILSISAVQTVLLSLQVIGYPSPQSFSVTLCCSVYFFYPAYSAKNVSLFPTHHCLQGISWLEL